MNDDDLSTHRVNIKSGFTCSSARALSCVMLHRVCCYISSELPAWINYSAPCHNSEDALIMTDSQTRQRSKCTHSPQYLWPPWSLRGHLILFIYFFFCRRQGREVNSPKRFRRVSSLLGPHKGRICRGQSRDWTVECVRIYNPPWRSTVSICSRQLMMQSCKSSKGSFRAERDFLSAFWEDERLSPSLQ